MDKLLYLTNNFKIKELADNESVTIEGFASTNDVDRHEDIIDPAVWRKASATANYKNNPIVLAYHNHSKPIGQVISLQPKNNGLFITAKISNAASEVFELIRQGVLKAFSIGFRTNKVEIDEKTDIMTIKDLELFEISVVSVPANQNTVFSVRKCFDNDNEFLQFKEQLLGVKSAISFNAAHPNGTPKAAVDTSWDGPAQVSKADVKDLLVMSAWKENKPVDKLVKGDFKLPHHTWDSHKVVFKGVVAAMAALLGARGGVNIPESDRKGVYNHLAKHYKEFDKEAPAFKTVEQYREEKERMDMEKIEEAIKKALAEQEAKRLEAEKAAKEKALAEKAAEEKAAKEKAAEITAKDNVEKLLEDVTSKLNDENSTIKEALDGFRTELAEKSAELEALQKNKMQFEDKDAVKFTERDVDTAVLVSKITGKALDETKFIHNLVEKSGQQHWSAGAQTTDWEQDFALRVENELRQQLKVEPLFTSRINMTTATMNIPVNPEAGTAEWVKLVGTALPAGTNDSSGNTVVHTLTDATLTAQKLATKEYVGFEEEEDAIVAIVPVIRDAIIRRSARATDIALLRGTGDTASAQGAGYDPITGVATLAANAGLQDNTSISIAGGNKVLVSTLNGLRRQLGKYGLDPAMVKYIVSTEAYYDLLEDPDFRTQDLVGVNATILNGQIGSANGSPVIVSGEFAAKAAGAHGAVAVYTGNFILGNYKNVTVERFRDIEKQHNVLVSTRRLGFIPVVTGQGAAVLTYAA